MLLVSGGTSVACTTMFARRLKSWGLDEVRRVAMKPGIRWRSA